MSDKLRRRTAARGWLTRSRKLLEVLVMKRDVSVSALVDAVEEFDSRLQALDNAQFEFELEADNLEKEIEEAGEYREQVKQVRIRAKEILSKLKVDSDDASSVTSHSTVDTSTPEVKLPKLELPKFSGDILQWETFWDQFNAVVHNSNLPDVSKFSYLRSLLEGEAKDAIKGLSLTESHYSVACEILKERFGRRERIIFQHVQELLSLNSSSQKGKSLSTLRSLQDSLLGHVRCLEALGITGDQYGVLLTPIVLTSLPSDIRIEWARKSEGKESDLTWLLEFLGKEIKLRETSQSFTSVSKVSEVKREEKRSKPSATALPTVTTPKEDFSKSLCHVCQRSHPTYKCWNLVKVPISERREKLKSKGLCYRCLNKGHLAFGCDKQCDRCKGDHHFLLCRKPNGGTSPMTSNPKKNEIEHSTVMHTGASTLVTDSRTVIMQTIEVEVRGRNGMTRANVFFDSGADRSYVSSDLVHRIDPEFLRSEVVSCCSFGHDKASEMLRNVYTLELRGPSKGCGIAVATEVPVVCAPLFRRKVPEDVLKSFSQVKLAENYKRDQHITIDILIGLDQYWKFVKPELVPVKEGLGEDLVVAQHTVFGWILFGSYVANTSVMEKKIAHQLLCVQNVRDVDLKKLWDIDLEAQPVESSTLQNFRESITMTDGRYEVALPWKHEGKAKELVDNRDNAEKRLRSLTRRLDRDPMLSVRYNEALKEMENNEVIEEVPSDQVKTENATFYLPHRPVVRESSVSTKIRPVFDASAQDSNGLSLNDCMETGPNLLPNLVEVLVRFRRWPIALVADIQKAFLQIAVCPEDRDVHRFLWKEEDVVRIMRFTRVPFGNRSSPFILNATIKHHLGKFESNHVVDELGKDLYVDDWLTGADSEEEAVQMIEEANEVMSKAGMNLTKWGSNNKDILDKALYNVSDKCAHLCNVKALGLRWIPSADCFKFDGIALESGLVITKRVVLSLVARLFDPLGFLAPFAIKLKCLFQDLWRLGVEWDAEIPEEMTREVLLWIEDLSLLKDWEIHRPYTGGAWRDIVSIGIHAFGDASEKAYGACVYIVTEQVDGTTSSVLVLSKAKVAPVKRVTLPRLELLGAVLAAQLLEFVRGSLGLEKECCRCWSDSMVVLSWIRGDPAKWKPFVANRVIQIQEITSPSQWFHCSGNDNPADLLTRGKTGSELMKSTLWLSGPESLKDSSGSLEQPDQTVMDDAEEELQGVFVCVNPKASRLFEVERWGTFIKAIRVVAWVKRFLHNVRVSPKCCNPDLSLSELEEAKIVLIRSEQEYTFSQEVSDLKQGGAVSRKSNLYKLSPYVGEDGLLRVKGRLDFAQMTYDEKHPVIIPKSHLAVLLVRSEHMFLKHAGVNTLLTSLRGRYWIIGARRIAKRVKKQCVSCQRQDARAILQPVAPLHKLRVTEAKPFSVTGMDHAGPLFCADHPGKKFYILLFTCAVVRAVHLELVDSLNLDDCICAIRRFVARRGMPSVIWSDNAKTFIAANQQLKKSCGPNSPQWNYIVPRSPWWGGWWERLVRSVKSALRKSIGQKCLTRVELETTLHEVEGCVNSRPLTFVGDDVKDRSPLTPACFLIGKGSMLEQERLDSSDLAVTKEKLEERKLVKEAQVDAFWSLWLNEYVRSLPSWKGVKEEKSVNKDDVVIVSELGCPRMAWPLGIVIETYMGRDGVIRSCKVRTRKGNLVRSVQKLHKLELEVDGEGNVPVVSTLKETNNVQVVPEKSCEVKVDGEGNVPVVSTLKETNNVQVVPEQSCEVRQSRRGRVIKPVNKLDL